VIINYPNDYDYYDPKKTIIFQMEPYINDEKILEGVQTWGIWSNPSKDSFLEVRGRHTEHHNNICWLLELTLNDLLNLKYDSKLDRISSICSSKYTNIGHKFRVDLLKYLDYKNDINLDIYSENNFYNFKNYKGQLSGKEKSKGIVPYKYYFMIENNFERNYITEKFWEPILCESLIFYYGCPNVTDYIDKDAFVLLDINDFEKSYQIIKQAIEEDWWSQRIEVIRREKQKILNELAFFPTIDKIINKNK
jgi:hypothetical protein